MRLRGFAKKIDVKKFIDNFRKDNAHADPEELERIARDLLDEVLARFTDNWYGGSNTPDPRDRNEFAELSFDYDVKVNADSVVLRVHTDNWLWNRLDEGWGERKTKRVEKFYPRLAHRTAPGELMLHGEPQVSDEPVYVAAGTKIRGVEPRHWRKAIAEELDARFKAEYPEVQVEITLE